ncbi:MAG: tetratricopeptide repeat protein [Pseudooceanicola sp.]
MNIHTLSRKEKRARIAKAAKLYGIKGEESLALHEAYQALTRGDLKTALQLAHPVTQSHPDNVHGWVILGGAALSQREGATAKAFFGRALDISPRDPVVLGGLAKAHVLSAEVEDAVRVAGEAIRRGSTDVSLIMLYMQFMGRLGRRLTAADVVIPAIRKIDDAALALELGDMLAEADEQGRAVEWLEKAWRLDPAPDAHKVARLRALLYAVRLEEAEALARELLDNVADRDTVALVLLTVLRVQRRLDEAEALAEALEFATPEGFAQARGIVANILQDRGDEAGADAAYTEAMHVGGETQKIAKAYGVYLFRNRDYAAGQPHFDRRFPEVQRRHVPLHNSAPEVLGARERLWIMAEQGIGDQLALLSLLRAAPLAEGCDVTLVGDARLGALLADNGLGVGHAEQTTFLSGEVALAPEEIIYLGDLTRYLADQPHDAWNGAFLSPDAARQGHLRRKYEAKAKGRPIIGLAWASRSLTGRLRSIALQDLVQVLPEESLVVNLQYGATKGEIDAARAARPDLDFVTDTDVDQMRDLAGFAAQIAALDRVVTIDNTTAHMAGALGHPGTHVLLPAGSECMWYWGTEGNRDDWYGNLNLHRQSSVGDWSAPLDAIRELPYPRSGRSIM